MPFDQLPDPEFLYFTKQHTEALTRMQLALAMNDSFAVVTGEIGSGKTTLVRKLLAELGDKCVTAFITHTRLTDIELLQLILVEFGVEPFAMGKSEMVINLQDFVREQHEQGCRAVIVVDEAQNFGVEVLEELRLLTCMDTEYSKAINIILVGQPQLSTTLRSPDLEQLRQRCRLRFHMNNLTEEETSEYVKHRLNVAAGKEVEIFDDVALVAVYEHARGVPRLINMICDTALIMARVSDRDTVSLESVEDAVEELDWSPQNLGIRTIVQDQLAAGAAGHISVVRAGKVIGEHVLSMPSYVIGRADDCSIVLDSRYLSRHHALISNDSRGWSISDLKSTNGIQVNGRNVQTWRLRDGDVVDIGECRLKFSWQKFEMSDVGTETEVLDPNMELPDLSAERSNYSGTIKK